MVRQLRAGVLGAQIAQTAKAAKTAKAAMCLCVLCILCARGVGAETLDRVLAVAAGQVILLSDVTAARDLGLQTATGAADPIRALLGKLVDRELVLAEVERYAPPEPDAAAVDRALQRLRDRFPSEQAFQAVLNRSGIDDKHVREMVRQDLRVAAYLDQRFASAGDRRTQLVDDWIAGLRRRGDVIYVTR